MASLLLLMCSPLLTNQGAPRDAPWKVGKLRRSFPLTCSSFPPLHTLSGMCRTSLAQPLTATRAPWSGGPENGPARVVGPVTARADSPYRLRDWTFAVTSRSVEFSKILRLCGKPALTSGPTPPLRQNRFPVPLAGGPLSLSFVRCPHYGMFSRKHLKPQVRACGLICCNALTCTNSEPPLARLAPYARFAPL